MAEAKRQRILLVTRNLPPLVGGMERLNWHMAEELAKAVEVRVVGPAGAAAMAPPGVPVTESPLRPLWKFLLFAAYRTWHTARRWRPDIVLAGSGLTAPLAWLAARASGARSAVYVHGLDIAVRHPLYRALWLPAIRHADRVIANSQATAALCRDIGVPPDRLAIVHPGVEMPVEVPPDAAAATAAAFRARHQLGSGPLLLSVGRLTTRKGLREFVANALPAIVAKYPDAMLAVIGEAPAQALHAQAQSVASIKAIAAQAGVEHRLRFLGVITDYAELGTAYRAANVHVFPVREIAGDPEGFGMVAVEAAAHGLPTVAFATGGVVDAVADGVSGHGVAPGDYISFAEAVVRLLGGDGAMRTTCITFAQQFAWPAFGQGVRKALGCGT